MPHEAVQAAAVGLVLPADPVVAHRQVQGREVVQQAAQQAPVAVLEEVAQVGAEGLAVAQRLVALDPFVPGRGLLAALDEPQPQRQEASQGAFDRWLGRAARPRLEGPLAAATGTLAGGQGQDAESLQLLQQAHRQLDAVAAAGGVPVQVLADGVAQFGAAQPGQEGDGLLDGGQLPAGRRLAEFLLALLAHAPRQPGVQVLRGLAAAAGAGREPVQHHGVRVQSRHAQGLEHPEQQPGRPRSVRPARAEAGIAGDDGAAQGALRGVVLQRNPRVRHEPPQPLLVLQQRRQGLPLRVHTGQLATLPTARAGQPGPIRAPLPALFARAPEQLVHACRRRSR